MRNLISRVNFNVCIEGNIGSGKTTLLNYFANLGDVQVLHEPVHRWRNLNGSNLLDLMYKEPDRWAHLFQTYVQLTMLENHLTPSTMKTKMMERSIHSARRCFVEHLYQSGKMTGAEYNVYCSWYKMIDSNMDVGVDLIVYLRTDPHVLHSRIIKRNRSEEAQIPLEYLVELHNLHEKWLVEEGDKLSTPVIVVDGNGSMDDMCVIYEKLSNRIIYNEVNEPSILREPSSPVKIKSTPC